MDFSRVECDGWGTKFRDDGILEDADDDEEEFPPGMLVVGRLF